MRRAFYSEFVTAEFLDKCGLESVEISIEIDRREYQRLRALLAGERIISSFNTKLTA